MPKKKDIDLNDVEKALKSFLSPEKKKKKRAASNISLNYDKYGKRIFKTPYNRNRRSSRKVQGKNIAQLLNTILF